MSSLSFERSLKAGQPVHALSALDLPSLLVHDEAVRANVDLMAQYCRRVGVELAPHAKTSMTSYIVDRQLDAGAWGQTAASIVQARHLRDMGVKRILLANVLVEARGVDWVAQHYLIEPSEETDFVCYVDSHEGVEIIERRLQEWEGARPLGVLVEVGFAGGRTGVRNLHEAIDLARRVSASDRLELRGVAGFEGLMPRDGQIVPPQIGEYLESVHRVVIELQAAGLLGPRPIVTAGGSSYFDLVVGALGPQAFSFPVLSILRSGCYVTHDHGVYRDTSPFDGRATSTTTPRFLPALELIASVLSRPEPELVIAGFGRRDVPTDDRLPVVLGVFDADGAMLPDTSAVVVDINDQHAFVRVSKECDWRPGDVLSLGVSHPCGAFDRWRSVPIVNALRDIVGTAVPHL
ncbi:alanine racemase [Aeromicrobium sp. P5_D10]